MRVRLTIDYIGTAYAGWQVQPDQITVQGVLEAALETLTGQKTGVSASGRTDAGVHALGQVAHFDCDKDWPPRAFVGGLNRYLPPDVRVLNAEIVPDDFHARFSAKRKTYVYRMYVSDVDRAVYAGRAYRVERGLDIASMRRAAARFVGRLDFSSLCASGADTTTAERTVTAADLTQSGDELYFTVTADGFLYNMVRIMVGLLLRVGRGKLTPDGVTAILDGRDRTLAPDTAPPYGLYLQRVEYDRDA